MKKIIVFITILVLMPVFLMANTASLIEKNIQSQTANTEEESVLTDYEKSLIKKISYEEALGTTTDDFKIYNHSGLIFMGRKHVSVRGDFTDIDILQRCLKETDLYIAEIPKELLLKHQEAVKNALENNLKVPLWRLEEFSVFEATKNKNTIISVEPNREQLEEGLIKEGMSVKNQLLGIISNKILSKKIILLEHLFEAYKKDVSSKNLLSIKQSNVIGEISFEDLDKFMDKKYIQIIDMLTNTNTSQKEKDIAFANFVNYLDFVVYDKFVKHRAYVRNIYLAEAIKKNVVIAKKKTFIMYGEAHYQALKPLLEYWDSLEK